MCFAHMHNDIGIGGNEFEIAFAHLRKVAGIVGRRVIVIEEAGANDI